MTISAHVVCSRCRDDAPAWRSVREARRMETTMQTATMDRPAKDRVCDCGHLPTWPRSEVTTGYGQDAQGRTKCFDCCAAQDRATVEAGERFCGYLSSDGKHVTNWPGSPLLRVTRETERTMYGFCVSRRTFLRAVDAQGRTWVGQGGGRGMFCRMRLSAVRQ